jgi:hypothetical protein
MSCARSCLFSPLNTINLHDCWLWAEGASLADWSRTWISSSETGCFVKVLMLRRLLIDLNVSWEGIKLSEAMGFIP